MRLPVRVATVVLALLASLMVSPPSQAIALPAAPAADPGCASDGTVRVCFSQPAAVGGNDQSVVNAFIRLFRSAGEGDSLRIAMFRWDIGRSVDALLAAQKRGAHVELVVDRDVVTNAAGKRLVREIEAADPTTTDVVVCKGACLPWTGRGRAPWGQDINHLKLVAAEIDSQQSVITSSLNLEARQNIQANSLLQMYDARAYAYSLSYFERLKAQSVLGWKESDKTQAGVSGGADLAVYPSRTDLLLETLQGIRCAKGMNTVDVMHAVIQRHDVRRALAELSESGCKVRIVVTRDLMENWLEEPIKLKGSRTLDIPDRRVKTILTHDKVYAIHALWKGKETHMVVTGTSNATCGGLFYNDELMVRLQGEWVWDQYRRHVARAFRHGYHSRSKEIPVQRRCR